MQTLVEWSVAIAVVAEPYSVPAHPRWFGGEGDSVAIYWSGNSDDPHCNLLHKGLGYVVVEWGPMVVVGCYISPNCGLAAFETYLDGLANHIRAYLPRPILVLGDFNAHSREWGDARDDIRGETILEWAAGLDLRLLNRGSISTCVRWQGESIVDLSWASPSAAQRISEWRVAEEIATLSDHRHIVFDVSLRNPRSSSVRHRNGPPRRWSLKRLDRDMLSAAAHVVDWTAPSELDPDI
jgi:hypothetical protein